MFLPNAAPRSSRYIWLHTSAIPCGVGVPVSSMTRPQRKNASARKRDARGFLMLDASSTTRSVCSASDASALRSSLAMHPRCSPLAARASLPMQYTSASVDACAFRLDGTPRRTTTRRDCVSGHKAASCAHVLSATARGATTMARRTKPRRNSSAMACSVMAVFPAPMSAQMARYGRMTHAQTISRCSSVRIRVIAAPVSFCSAQAPRLSRA